MNDAILNNYQRWTERAIADVDVINELKDIAENEGKIEDAFYKDLAFGTGGLRGVIGAGTNRLNVYTVAKASQGLADYVIKNFAPEKRKIAVSFDSRIKSDVFAKVASGVFAANGIKVEIYSELMPTPCLSFAVRYLGCAAGVMVTASHNPAKYNGYKVYEEADSLRSLADELNISLLKLRKLLITADVFTSDICTEINDLYQSGKKIPEIMKLTGLSRASVHSYLPYTKGIYNAAEISLNAERCRTYKNRQEKVRLLKEIPSEENLWQAVIAFQDYPFKTATGLPFRYKLKVGKNGGYNRELMIDRREKSKSLAWSSVVLAFENSKRVSEEVKKPKALGDIRGVSYIYPILWRFGLIRVPEAIEKKMGKQR